MVDLGLAALTESCRRVEVEQRQVCEQCGVRLQGQVDDPFHRDGTRGPEAEVPSQDHSVLVNSAGEEEEKGKKKKKKKKKRRHQQTGGAAAVQLPDFAVAGGEHPAILEQHATAEVVAVVILQADLPGPGVGVGSADPTHLVVLGRHVLEQCGQGRGRGRGLAGGLATWRLCNSHNIQGSKVRPRSTQGSAATPTYR